MPSRPIRVEEWTKNNRDRLRWMEDADAHMDEQAATIKRLRDAFGQAIEFCKNLDVDGSWCNGSQNDDLAIQRALIVEHIGLIRGACLSDDTEETTNAE